MFQVDSLKRASPSPSRSSQRAYRQPRVITVNRDVATMVESQCRPETTGAPSGGGNGSGDSQDQPCASAEWEAECSSVPGAPFRSRTFSDGFIRNTSQELLLGVDCEACRSLQVCPPPADRTTWPAHHPAWHDATLSHRDFDLVCNCNVKQYNYLDYPGDGADGRPPPHRADIYDIERIKRDTGRTNLTAGTHHSLDRKHAKSKTIGVSGYISKQLVSYDPASNLVQKIKRNLSNLKKIGEEAISKKHQHGVQMSEMPLDPGGSLRKSHLSLAEKSVGRYSQSCIFTSSDFQSKTDPQNGVTYTNFTGNIDQCFDRNKDPGFVSERKTPSKLVKMRSLDNNDGFVGRSSSALGSGSSKFSTLDSRSSRCRSIPRQMSYNEFTTEAMSGGFVCGAGGGVGGGGTATLTEEAGGVQTYTHEFAEADLVMLESSPRAVPPAPSYRCTCTHNVDKKIASHFYDMQEEKRATPAPDVTARAPGGGGGGGGGRRAAERCAVCKGAAPQWSYTGTASSHSSTTTGNSSRFTLAHRKWCCVAALVLVAGTACVAGPLALRAPPGAPLAERLRLAERLLHETPLIDGHNDLPWNIRKFLHNRIKDFKFDEDLRTIPPWATSSWSHTDLPRMKQGRIAAQFWAAYVPCDAQHRDAVQLTFEQIDVIQRLTDKYQPQLTLCTSARDIVAAHANHQVCSLVGVEGGHAIGGSLGVLRTLYQVGVRYLTLTSTCDTPWAECSSATERALDSHAQGGLSPFGRVVIKEMNRLGMLVDLSHVSARTMRDALAVSRAPVLFSHSSARALCNATRNVPDAVLRKLAVNKGLVMVNFYASFLACKPTATVHDAIAHINHIRDVAGVDSVGLGAGFDGINYTPQGLEDVSSYPLLFAELMEAGWSMEELRKLAGLNLLRVLEAAERVARELTSAQVAPYEDSPPRPPDPHNCSSQEV